jgi:hypothetical protein
LLNRTASARAGLTCALIAAVMAGPLAAQDTLVKPQLSPPALVTGTVGFTEITVEYHSPAVRDRKIFGGKVPFGVVWRAGANNNTTISFSHDVTIEGEDLPAGKYGLHMVPGEDRWVIIFNDDSDAWGSYSYSEKKDALRVTVHPRRAPEREHLAFLFDDVSDAAATLTLHWAETIVPIRIGVDLTALVLAPVREAVLGNGENTGWQFWFEAAEFGVTNDVDAAETLDWTERSIKRQRTFSNLWLHSELLAETGAATQAGEVRGEALKLVNVNELQNLGYRYVLRDDLKSAVYIFEQVVEMGAASWWPYVMLGEAKGKLGDNEGAIAALQAALGKNPDDVTRDEIKANLESLGAT